MEQPSLPTELILTHSQRSLGSPYLDWMPQPGSHIIFEGQAYAVLERNHRYQFKANRYHLHRILLHVQPTVLPEEKSFVNHQWVIGDATCRYNAHSEILRCSVNPDGPCQGCREYSAR